MGGAGIAPNVQLVDIQVTDSSGTMTTNRILDGISKMTSFSPKIQIACIPACGTQYSTLMEEAIHKAIARGITIVAAMGDDGTNIKTYPAALDVPGVIAVTSCTKGRIRDDSSNYGSWSDVMAPGADILSTLAGSYSLRSGTQMAAGVVTGVGALYLSKHMDTSPDKMEKIIRSAVTNGIIDASKLFLKDKTKPDLEIQDFSSGTASYGTYIIDIPINT